MGLGIVGGGWSWILGWRTGGGVRGWGIGGVGEVCEGVVVVGDNGLVEDLEEEGVGLVGVVARAAGVHGKGGGVLEAGAEPGKGGARAKAREVGPDRGNEEAMTGEGARAVFVRFVFGSVTEDGGGGEDGIFKVVGEERAGDGGIKGDGGGAQGG